MGNEWLAGTAQNYIAGFSPIAAKIIDCFQLKFCVHNDVSVIAVSGLPDNLPEPGFLCNV